MQVAIRVPRNNTNFSGEKSDLEGAYVFYLTVGGVGQT